MQDKEWPRLADDCWLYPAAKNLHAIDKVSGEFVRGAFMRKGPNEKGELRDQKGVSVTVCDQWTEEQTIEAIKEWFNPQGIGKLSVGEVRAIEPIGSLDAVQDRANHANIIGLPAYGEDVVKAERLAGLLAKKTKVVYIRGNRLFDPLSILP